MLTRLFRVSCNASLAALALWALSAAAAEPRPAVQYADGSAAPASDDARFYRGDQVPTPAPRGLDSPALQAPPETIPAPAAPSAARPVVNGGAPLSPVPDSKYLGPSTIEVTSFHGITPGASTRADVEKIWGKAKQTKGLDSHVVQWYAVDPFPRVEVVYTGEKVTELIIRFDRAFPASQVAEQLGQLELTKVQPVLVLNELGEVLGQAYPERGVMFAFEPAADPNKALKKVTHLVLEAISAESFVLRAETNIDSRPEFSLHDADQAIKLQPANARSHWLRSRALTALGQHEQAAEAAAEAVRLDPRDARYQVTKAQTLQAVGNIAAATAEADKAVALSESRPHVKARAICLLGDLAAAGPKPDYKQAMKLHSDALQAADALLADKHPAIRVAAKEVLLDAHLGALAWTSPGARGRKRNAPRKTGSSRPPKSPRT